MRLRQPKLPEGTWDITVWDPPSYFEWTHKTGGITSTAGHRVDALDPDHARLTLTLDMRGFLIPVIGPPKLDVIRCGRPSDQFV